MKYWDIYVHAWADAIEMVGEFAELLLPPVLTF
jgi:hypothetical protein